MRAYFDMDTRLGNVPDDWLKYVEPKIERPAETQCWLWTGGCDSFGEPVLNITDPITKRRTGRRLKLIVARMFWSGITNHQIVHECGVLTCLRPSHLFVSSGNWKNDNREIRIKRRKDSMKRYALRLKRK